MMRKSASAVLLLSLLIAGVPAYAQDNVTAQCLGQVYDRIAHEERVYRSVLFGQKKSADLPQGSVRFDKTFKTWLKTGDGQWRTPAGQDTASDSTMDSQADVPRRRGIFEIRKTPTSNLIPPLLQSMRALQCRLRSACQAARMSQSVTSETVKAQIDGCLQFEFPTFTACKGNSITSIGLGSCDGAVEGVLAREEKLLELIVAYDGAYRTLMQFAGTFEGFMVDFRFPLLEPLWQTVRTLGAFDKLPCFLAQCDQ
jgi:hypothetical protein